MKYRLTLTIQGESSGWDYHSIDALEADNMIHLLSQFNILIAQTMKKLHVKEVMTLKEDNDSDVPF